MKNHFGIVVALAVLAVNTASAAENVQSGTNGVTIETLVAEALEKNPELKFYRGGLAAAKAGRKAAGLWSNPEVSGSVGYKTSSERTTGLNAEGVAWSVSLAQPFEWPGRIGLRKSIANRDV